MHQSRGTTLIELTLTLSACVVVLTMSTGLIHRAMHAHSRARRFFDGERSAQRLSESFRRDVHAAVTATTGDKASDSDLLLRLQRPGGEAIEYRQASGRVERVLYENAAATQREAFVFPMHTQFVAAQESPQLVTLAIAPVPPAEGGSTNQPLLPYTILVHLRVEAVLGRNVFLAQTPESMENAP